MASSITAAMLYDMVVCPHRVSMDVHVDPAQRDAANAQRALLWRRAMVCEAAIAHALTPDTADHSGLSGADCERATAAAMAARKPLIYRGCIRDGELLGTPDLLRLDDDGYVAGSIRSGAVDDGAEHPRTPRRGFAMQLALYTDILERMDLSAGRYGFVIDGRGDEIAYELDAPRGPRTALTLWQEYQKALALVREIVLGAGVTRPAWSSVCRICVWQSSCLERLEREDDPSLLPEVGRSTRDMIAPRFPTIASLAAADPEELVDEARQLEGVGGAMLSRLYDRAQLAARKRARAYRRAAVELPESRTEIFLSVELDPLRDHCFLHGLLERVRGKKPRYRAFFADDASEEAEENAFALAWSHLAGAGDAVIYHYGVRDRAVWRLLQERYPQVCDADELEALFAADTTVDLFTAVVRPRTEWPTREYSVRAIADYLGVARRHAVPEGAGYAEPYEQWLAHGEKADRALILACNEDDCLAVAAVLDAVRELEPG